MKLIEKIQKAGIENCLFLVPMKPLRTYFGFISLTSSSDPDFIVPAKITEERYKIIDEYKITLKPIHDGFAKEHFYIHDLQSLISDGNIQFYVRS